MTNSILFSSLTTLSLQEPEQQRLLGYGSISFPISTSTSTSFSQHLQDSDHRVPFPNLKISDLPNNEDWKSLSSSFGSKTQKLKSKSQVVIDSGIGSTKKKSKAKIGLREIESLTGIKLPDWWDGNHSNQSISKSNEKQVQEEEQGYFVVKAERRAIG